MKKIIDIRKMQVHSPNTPNFPQRKTMRLKNYDYSQAGLYFITICIDRLKNPGIFCSNVRSVFRLQIICIYFSQSLKIYSLNLCFFLLCPYLYILCQTMRGARFLMWQESI